jgi:hypothetical protein
MLTAFAVAGAAFVYGAHWAISSFLAGRNAETTDGTVVALIDISGDRGGYVPVIEYEVNGNTYRCQGQVGVGCATYTVGETVRVLYQADRPELGALDSFLDRWATSLMFGAGGGFLLLLFSLGSARGKVM